MKKLTISFFLFVMLASVSFANNSSANAFKQHFPWDLNSKDETPRTAWILPMSPNWNVNERVAIFRHTPMSYLINIVAAFTAQPADRIRILYAFPENGGRYTEVGPYDTLEGMGLWNTADAPGNGVYIFRFYA